MKAKRKVGFVCFLLILICMLPMSAQAATKAKKGIYKKTYSAPAWVTYKPGNALIVTKISGSKITFVLEHYGLNGSPLYQTNTIKATLKNNKVSKFKWKDNWGNSGTGSIKFTNKKATVTVKTQKYSARNRSGWWTKETMPYEKKATAAKNKYYSNLKF